MIRPAWLDPTLYPFASHHLDVGPGRMHYVDEGEGVPIVMVHGTPSWSFLYRNLIQDLSNTYRCVAPDHLGFGLSDTPEAFAYTPEVHAKNLETLIETLGLKDIVLMVHDFGGPIGLPYALDHPENVRALVIMNTWLWRYQGLERAGRVLGNPFGRFLYECLNFSVNVLLKQAFSDKAVLTRDVLNHYREPFPTPASREPLFALVNTINASNAWFETLWDERDAITDKPALLIWGMKDKLVPPEFLLRWQETLKNVETLKLENAGHFVQEEAGQQVAEAVRGFLRSGLGNIL